MSSSSSQRPPAPRTYPQDYIARIRYNNSLPPPIGPPKLLDIPNTAFAQYTDTGFASALARSEPLNIEVDSELGMPLDLVHCPRVFEGDDSILRPIEPTPPVDPRDRLLLRPAASLGKPIARTASGGSSVSFLRRTEYISAEQSRSTFKSTTSLQLIAIPTNKRRTQQRPEDTDPVRILAAVMRGFDVANPDDAGPQSLAAGDKAAQNAERNWKELKHPNKPGVKAVETFPLLPHLEGMSDTGGYMVFKFLSAPTDRATEGNRDVRVDASLFQPVERAADDEDEVVDRKEQFDFYIPDTTSTAKDVKRKFSYDSDVDEEEEFRYKYVRRYETKDHRNHTAFDQQPEEVALSFHKGDEKKPRGAYFYPILTRYTIRPKRKNKLQFSSTQREEVDEPPAEALKLKIRETDQGEKRRRVEFISRWDGAEPVAQQPEEAHDDEEDAPGEDE
ncbi:RNA polymerase II-associated [Sphaerosporella brunnea]|uniref:RNA polymerase II-associated n=1 Tax=Sphaerosporella brunnea TaxID=1250544 RepID=A0A5J5EVX6_9PEZI|nr:RNA polymerase II-associated [Sphaerosporella brunnea]KAA8904855.1 RNA polymerase II-associated [Sphaerosporella brunnea]